MLRNASLALVAIVTLVASTAAFASEAPAVPELSTAQIQELMSGEVIASCESGEPDRGEVIALIHAPADELYQIVIDYDRADEWSPAGYDISQVGEEGGAAVVDGKTRLPWPIPDRTWRVRSESGQQVVDGKQSWVNTWSYIPGTGNLDDTFGYWLLVPWDADPSYTLVRYVVNADPGVALPDIVIRWATRRALPDLIEGLTERHRELYLTAAN